MYGDRQKHIGDQPLTRIVITSYDQHNRIVALDCAKVATIAVCELP